MKGRNIKKVKGKNIFTIILTIISIVNVCLLELSYIYLLRTKYIYIERIYYYIIPITLALQIINIVLLYLIRKKRLDKKGFIIGIIISILIIIITFFVPVTETYTYTTVSETKTIRTTRYENIYTLKIFETDSIYSGMKFIELNCYF